MFGACVCNHTFWQIQENQLWTYVQMVGQMDGERDRCMDKKDRWREGEKDRQRDGLSNRCMDKTDRVTYRWMDRRLNELIDRRTYRKMDGAIFYIFAIFL